MGGRYRKRVVLGSTFGKSKLPSNERPDSDRSTATASSLRGPICERYMTTKRFWLVTG